MCVGVIVFVSSKKQTDKMDSDYYKPIDNSSSVVNGNLHSTNNIDSAPIKLD